MPRPELKIDTRHGTVALRPATGGPSEEAFSYLLFACNRAAEMALMPISRRDKEFLLQVQFRSMNETYHRTFPKARCDIIELDRWPIGPSSARFSPIMSISSTLRCYRKRKASASARWCWLPHWKRRGSSVCPRGCGRYPTTGQRSGSMTNSVLP
jgi:hypothetical protein